MIPNVVRGERMSGLMMYLVGPGKTNEHTEPHLIAGDPALLAWHDDAELDREAALGIARHLERPRSAYGVNVNGGHVWHCSLSIGPEEGLLTDEKWQDIANDFVHAMGFDDHEGTKSPCRWVAVRHGVSKNGNDHIHLAVNLVREDGTKASIHNDFRRSQSAARALEVKYGLEQLESVKAERSTRGYDPAERESVARRRAKAKYERQHTEGEQPGSWENLTKGEKAAHVAAELSETQPRHELALKVRAAAAASESEAEFVRRLRRSGCILRPRFAENRTDVITGYSVAERPHYGERPVWYGGLHLGRDLSLPRLRGDWPDTPGGATEAAAEWNAAMRGRRVVHAGREAQEITPEAWEQQSTQLGELIDRLNAVDVNDRDTWATVARQAAGALAAWSNATEDTPGDLAAASEALSRSAQTFRRTVTPHKAGTTALSGTAMLLASAMHSGKGAVAQAAMIRQLLRVTQAVHSAAVAGQQVRQAKLLAEDTRARLVRVRDAMPRAVQTDRGQATGTVTLTDRRDPVLEPQAQAMLDRLRAGQGKPATPGSPVPNAIEPSKERHTTKPDATRGPER